MKKFRSFLAVMLIMVISVSGVSVLGAVETAAATYAKIPALQISRVYQPPEDNVLCYWSSVATVQGYCLGTYTYGGITTNYRIPGKDYKYTDRADAITKYFKDKANGYANSENNMNGYPVPMIVDDGKDIGRNAATYQKIYNQLAQGKPVIVYTGGHASVVIGYNGSTTKLEPTGFTVLEVKKTTAKVGYWWVNSADYYNKYANNPQEDSASGSFMSCYVDLDSWITYCGGGLQEIAYPKKAVNTEYTFKFATEGGSGTMADIKAKLDATVTFPECTFTYDGYTCDGYYAQRKSDSKWHVAGVGWKTLQEIRDGNLQRSVYEEGLTFTMNTSWSKDGGFVGDTITLVPVWKPVETNLEFYLNTSGTNYMPAINSETFADFYQSRNTSVYNLSVEDGALKIVGSAAGGTGKDMLFKSQTNKSICANYMNGDNRKMTLTFKAKSSVDGAKMYFRWGYTTDLQTVTLTKEWKEYTIDMSKQPNDGAHMHPYLDKAGTFYIKDMVLLDEGASSPTGEETWEVFPTRDYTVGKTYADLPTPVRTGYIFKGWYTQKSGGEKITSATPVFDSHTAVYARWERSAGILMGDADSNGTVNIKDATQIQKSIAGLVTLTTTQNLAANVYTEDALNVKDATAIQKWLTGLDCGNAVINELLNWA